MLWSDQLLRQQPSVHAIPIPMLRIILFYIFNCFVFVSHWISPLNNNLHFFHTSFVMTKMIVCMPVQSIAFVFFALIVISMEYFLDIDACNACSNRKLTFWRWIINFKRNISQSEFECFPMLFNIFQANVIIYKYLRSVWFFALCTSF